MHSNWIFKIQRILEEFGRPDLWLNQFCNHYCSKMIKSVLEAHFLQTWSTKLESSSKGLNYRLIKDSINLESFFFFFFYWTPIFVIHLGTLRIGNHRFPRERGQWRGLDINERKCTRCKCLEVGDEFHYLLVCPFFSSERKLFIEKHYYSNPNSTELNFWNRRTCNI